MRAKEGWWWPQLSDGMFLLLVANLSPVSLGRKNTKSLQSRGSCEGKRARAAALQWLAGLGKHHKKLFSSCVSSPFWAAPEATSLQGYTIGQDLPWSCWQWHTLRLTQKPPPDKTFPLGAEANGFWMLCHVAHGKSPSVTTDPVTWGLSFSKHLLEYTKYSIRVNDIEKMGVPPVAFEAEFEKTKRLQKKRQKAGLQI